MCLSRKYTEDELKEVVPAKRFYAYKMLDVAGSPNALKVYTSPYYARLMPSTGWTPGEHVANLKGGSEAGFYVILLEPGFEAGINEGYRRVVRLEVDPADVRTGGPDSFLGRPSTVLVCSKVTLTEEAYNDLNSNEHAERSMLKAREFVHEAVKAVKKIAKRAAQKKQVDVKTVKKSVKKTAAITKKVAIKEAAAEANARATLKKASKKAKVTKKAVAKTVKTVLKKVGKKTVKKAPKTKKTE